MFVTNRFYKDKKKHKSNQENAAIKWTEKLSKEKIAMIEKTCQSSIKELGYANFNNQKYLKDILEKTHMEIWPYTSLFT